MTTHIIGIDIGFGFTKATNGHEFLVFKSLYGEAVDMQIKENLLEDNTDSDHLQIDIDDTSYFVGELAERQSSERTFTLDQSRFVSSSSRILALATLSKLVQEPDTPVKLVVGLPIGHYRQYKDDLATMLRATHRFHTVDAEGRRKPVHILVDDVRVLPQPIGTVMDSLLTPTGAVQHKRFATDKIGIIDVGFRTTDYTISDKGRYSERGSLTTSHGIARAFTQIGNKLKEACGVDVEIYRLYDAVEKGTIKVRGKAYDLKKITERAFGQLASQIAADANQVWMDDWDMDAIMVTGGGGAVLLPYMEKDIAGAIIPIKQDLDYRLHNVRGYYKFGLYTWANPSKRKA